MCSSSSLLDVLWRELLGGPELVSDGGELPEGEGSDDEEADEGHAVTHVTILTQPLKPLRQPGRRGRRGHDSNQREEETFSKDLPVVPNRDREIMNRMAILLDGRPLVKVS